jgi:hypothetical protein
MKLTKRTSLLKTGKTTKTAKTIGGAGIARR